MSDDLPLTYTGRTGTTFTSVGRGRRSAEKCRVYWGSHGCQRDRGHRGAHICCGRWPWLRFLPGVKAIRRRQGEVGWPPYYGPETRFYGEDAESLGLPLVTADSSKETHGG